MGVTKGDLRFFYTPKSQKSELNGLNCRLEEGLKMQQLGYHIIE